MKCLRVATVGLLLLGNPARAEESANHGSEETAAGHGSHGTEPGHDSHAAKGEESAADMPNLEADFTEAPADHAAAAHGESDDLKLVDKGEAKATHPMGSGIYWFGGALVLLLLAVFILL